jgi:putative sigma-54 modulation protein
VRITIKAKNLTVTDSLQSYVEKKVSRLDRYLSNIDEAQVDLVAQNAKSAQDRQVAQITLRSGSGMIFRAEERSSDIRASLDASLDKLSRQIKRYKGKHWQSKARAQVEVVEATEPDEDLDGELVRVKRFQTRPMSVEEAIQQMELLGHDFFVFFNASTEGFSVVYRRNDGGYGLLLPEMA